VCSPDIPDVAKCLESGTTRGRTLSPTSKVFYGLLLNNGSPWAHKFVSGILFGPGDARALAVAAADALEAAQLQTLDGASGGISVALGFRQRDQATDATTEAAFRPPHWYLETKDETQANVFTVAEREYVCDGM
jgi:hypothetical protein